MTKHLHRVLTRDVSFSGIQCCVDEQFHYLSLSRMRSDLIVLEELSGGGDRCGRTDGILDVRNPDNFTSIVLEHNLDTGLEDVNNILDRCFVFVVFVLQIPPNLVAAAKASPLGPKQNTHPIRQVDDVGNRIGLRNVLDAFYGRQFESVRRLVGDVCSGDNDFVTKVMYCGVKNSLAGAAWIDWQKLLDALNQRTV